MTRNGISIATGALFFVTGMAMPVFAQTTATPDQINMTIQEAKISTDDITYMTIFDSPVEGVKLDKTSSPPEFGRKEQIPSGTYQTLRLTITEMSWDANWANLNRSPCDGVASGQESGMVDLGGNTVFYFKTPELGGNTLAHYQANPPLSGYVGDADHPFVLASPIKVLKDSITTVNLIIGVADTLSCDSLDIYDRADGPNITLQRTMIGPATRFNGLEGVYVDTDNDEIGVTNSIANSVAIYNRTDTGDPPLRRTIVGPATRLNEPAGITLFADPDGPAGDEIIVANQGNDSVTIYNRMVSENARPLRTIVGTETELSSPVGIYVDAVNDEIGVANTGNNSVTIYSRTASENTEFLYHIGGDLTGLNSPCGLYVDTDNSEIWVTNSGGDGSITIYDRNQVTDLITFPDGNVPPIRTISGPSTGLSKPCGLYVDTDNDEIGVANSGDDTVRFYSRTQIIDNTDPVANVAPIFTIMGVTGPRGLSLDSDNNEIWVVHRGQQVVMADQPPIFPSSSNADSNADAAGSALAGDYNIVFYGVDFKGVNGQGILIPVVFAARGTGIFDPTTLPWPRFNFRLDTRIERQVLEPDCPEETGLGELGELRSEIYGVNRDGSFYAFMPEASGSLQGAFLPDGSAFVGLMVDNPNTLLLVYGVRQTGTTVTPFLTSDGTAFGLAAHYGFTSYRNDLFTTRPAFSSEILRYLLAIGMAETDATNFFGASGDANLVSVINPMGKFGDPASGGAVYREDFGPLKLRSQFYTSLSGGLLGSPSDGLSGALTADGSTLIFIRDIVTNDDGCPTDIEFGMGLRQGPAGAFSTESLQGTYFLAAFGDRFNPNTDTTLHRATAANITFDGAGGVEITFIENAGGVISFDQASFTYEVTSRRIPSQGDTALTVDVVDFFDRTATDPYASALIGEDGQSLAFFRSLNPGGSPNRTRLLGLALFQHP